MTKTIKIGSKEVGMCANAASPILYKKLFHKDFLLECQKPEIDTNIIMEMGFIMAMCFEFSAKHCANLSYDDFLEWLECFAPWDMIEAASDILAIWKGQEEPSSVPKN